MDYYYLPYKVLTRNGPDPKDNDLPLPNQHTHISL